MKFKKNTASTKDGEISSGNVIPFWVRARPYLILMPALLLTIGILYPFFSAIYYSLTNFSFRLPTHEFVWFKNYINMFKTFDFWHALWVTISYALLTTGTELVLGMGIALMLYKSNNRYTKILRVGLIFPLMIPPVIATLVWQLMTNNSVGILEKFLNLFNIYNFPWASSPTTAMFTAGLIDVWVYTPFVMVLLLAGLQSMPKSPFESANIDGGSALFTFRRLTLPMIMPNLYIALIFRLMAAMQEFSIIFALTKGGPGDTLMNLSITAYNTGFTFQKLGAALPYILVMWVIIYITSKKLVEKWQSVQKTASGN